MTAPTSLTLPVDPIVQAILDRLTRDVERAVERAMKRLAAAGVDLGEVRPAGSPPRPRGTARARQRSRSLSLT